MTWSSDWTKDTQRNYIRPFLFHSLATFVCIKQCTGLSTKRMWQSKNRHTEGQTRI